MRLLRTKVGRVPVAPVVAAAVVVGGIVEIAQPSPPLQPALPGTVRVIPHTPEWGNILQVVVTNPTGHPQPAALEISAAHSSEAAPEPAQPKLLGGYLHASIVDDPIEFGYKMIALGTLAPHETVTVDAAVGPEYSLCYGGSVIPVAGGKRAGRIPFDGPSNGC
jgi:hypothetical protein